MKTAQQATVEQLFLLATLKAKEELGPNNKIINFCENVTVRYEELDELTNYDEETGGYDSKPGPTVAHFTFNKAHAAADVEAVREICEFKWLPTDWVSSGLELDWERTISIPAHWLGRAAGFAPDFDPTEEYDPFADDQGVA